MVGIYKFTNLINGKSYIGQSINIDKRIKEHFWKSENENDVSFNSILHQAIRKYGAKNFSVDVVIECDVEDLDEMEKYYIIEYNTITPNGYNILSGGQKNRFFPNFCKDCGKQITRDATYCHPCSVIHQKKVDNVPDPLELARMIKNSSFSEVGRKFGVSDNAVKRWCKKYDIPYLKNELIDWYDNQVNNIVL